MDDSAYSAAREYLRTDARVLERRIAERVFDAGPAEPVLAALAAFGNDDGGFGHGLEPDKRVPDSQPLDVQVAFELMDLAGAVDETVVASACDWLATLGPAVGCLLPSALDYPRAGHWQAAGPPDLNPTAAIAGLLWKWDVDHPWRDAATTFCDAQLAEGLPGEAHDAACALTFLAHRPGAIRPEIPVDMAYYKPEAGSDAYGLTPLDLVHTADHPFAELFSAEVLDGHLDALEAAQLSDGGWPIAWEPPGRSAYNEWRGLRTLRALVTLRSFGRLP